MGRCQSRSNAPDRPKARARFGDALMQERARVEWLVSGTHHRKARIGIEILASQIGQTQGQIGKLWKPLGFFGICSKPRRIDENLAPVETPMENIAIQF